MVTRNYIRRLLAPLVQLREGESTTAALMFAYSFLAMTACNIVKPITRSKFISDLGVYRVQRGDAGVASTLSGFGNMV